ncbi:MAG: hypothetical protein II563_10485 [Treponema sp.]|nr:hypothetical protein [Treponema sp.]
MGVFISLLASNKVDPIQWEKAYEETLVLVDKMGLVEIREFEKFGQKYFAATSSTEREHHRETGWLAEGDAIFMATAEDFFLPRKIDTPRQEENYSDPLMYILAQEGIVDFKNPYVKNVQYFWGSKTQGEPYHTALLAIGCLLDSRLNGETICSSDITYGQCECAIEKANKILKKKIGMPLRCRMEDLYKRVRQLPIEPCQMLDAFAVTYLGAKDKRYYKFVAEHFSDEEQYLFVKEKINDSYLGTIGFANSIQQILSYDVPIAKVCSAFLEMDPKKKKPRENGENPFQTFIKTILATNIYLPEKDMRDCLKVDENSDETMCVEKQFASILFMGARNRSVARYIPLEELTAQLVESLGDKCDVKGIIDNYLKDKEQKQQDGEMDIFAKLNDFHDEFNKKFAEEKKKYDVSRTEYFIFFQKGDSVSPKLLNSLKITTEFYKTTIDEPQFAKLFKGDYEDRCRYLEKQNRALKLMDFEWQHIFDDIRDNPESFKRYYPMVRIEINHRSIHDFIRAYVVNDDFYEMCQTLVTSEKQ